MPTSERVGKNEALFRDVNDRILEVSARHLSLDGEAEVGFLCECSRADCHQTVELTISEYTSVRADSRHFLIAPGHVGPETDEHEVAANGRFAIVEKIGLAGAIADGSDPRS